MSVVQGVAKHATADPLILTGNLSLSSEAMKSGTSGHRHEPFARAVGVV